MGADVKLFYEKTLICLFVLFLGGFLAFSLLLPDQSFSPEENRVLQQMPAFSWRQVYEGKWTEKWEKYTSDQFPGRNLWISGKSLLQKVMGQKDINGVYLGDHDYLLQKLDLPNQEKLDENLLAILTFAEKHPDYGVKLALIPTSTAVLADYLPRYAQPVDEVAIMQQAEQKGKGQIPVFSLYPELAAHKEETIYYHTDHHWTTLGAYYGYVALGDFLGYEPYDLSAFTREPVSDTFYGTLYSKGNFSFIPPDKIELFHLKDALAGKEQNIQVTVVDDGTEYDSFYVREKLLEKDQYTLFLGGNHAYVKIETGAGTGKRLHLIKDSFSHCLVPFLALHYDEIHLYDLRYFHHAFADYIQGGENEDVLILYNMASYFQEGTIKDLQYK
ncbi:MAG: hypothetical protein HFI72_04160 [Peptococcaceae bacterium]|nr:hypothetical protein [Peptococcaceae bacterium]